MRVTNVSIKNGFKRFADLTVGPIPPTAGLVVLLGGNGSGKSSLLEALHYWFRRNLWNQGYQTKEVDYYRRPRQQNEPQVAVKLVDTSNDDPTLRNRGFHFRSAYRFTGDLRTTAIRKSGPIESTDQLASLGDMDSVVENHYNRLAGKALASFADLGTKVTNQEVYEKDILPLSDSLNRLYPDISLTGLGDPTDDGTFLFTKGAANDFKYMNLSSGEKAAFDLLLDLYVRRLDYPQSVICLDEPESHIALRTQGAFLDEMLRTVPMAQFWIASHSAGMIRRAFELAKEKPGSVVFLDFDGHDFDGPVTISPSKPSRLLWKKIHEVTLDDIASLVSPRILYLCEGDRAASGAKRSFDAQCYELIFGDKYPDVDFISVGGSSEIPAIRHTMTTVTTGTEIRTIVDRDGLTPEEVIRRTSDSSQYVLAERDIENYLLSDEVIGLLCTKYADDPDATQNMLAEKQKFLAAANSPDDVKSIAGQLFQHFKSLAHLAQPGSDRHQFLRDICAPLIVEGTSTFRDLEVALGLSH